jgi:hypothetical protein
MNYCFLFQSPPFITTSKIMLRKFKLIASITSVQRSFIRAMTTLIPPFRMCRQNTEESILLFSLISHPKIC